MLEKHVIYIPFSGVGLFDDPDDNNWLDYRIKIFKDFTLNSLLNQSLKPDLLWLSFDGREGSPLIDELEAYLWDKVPTVITYNGLIYKDDKYIFRLRTTPVYASTFSYAWRMLGRTIKRKNSKIFIRFIYRLLFKNLTLASRLDKSLLKVRLALAKLPGIDPKTIEQFNLSENFNYIYLTRLDSDDMIDTEWIEELSKHEPLFQLCFTRDRGYIYNTNTKELAHWLPIKHPQFFTLCIPSNVFRKGKFFKEYWGNYISHEDVTKVFKSKYIKDHQYLMLIHGNQISSTWNHPFKGKLIESSKVNEILKRFGILSI